MHPLTIVSAYAAIDQYCAAARARPPAEHATLYQRFVIAPVWQQLVAGAEYERIAPFAFTPPTGALAALADAAVELGRQDIEARIAATFEQAARSLPGPATTVCVLPLDPLDTVARDLLNGIVGYCLGAGRIVVHINPRVPTWRTWLAYTLLHEHHHSAWTARQYRPFDLATRLVFEGRADAFARLHHPHLTAPWTAPLTRQQTRQVWQRMRADLAVTDWSVVNAYIFGGQNDLPRWAGYAMGFAIVRAFLQQHSNLTVAEWTALDPQVLIRESGYGALPPDQG